MGAFFLYKTQSPVNINAVKSLFCAKGFIFPPLLYEFGSWTLLHYRKQLIPHESFNVIQSCTSLFAVGTFVYKRYGLRKSLEVALADYCAGQLDKEAFLGAYALLFIKNEHIAFLTDRMNLFHVFTNDDNSIFSSSFAAILKASQQKFRLNIPAVIENVLTGYIIAPDTIVHGVHLVDDSYRRTINIQNLSFLHHSLSDLQIEPLHNTSFEDCVDEQVMQLDCYFSSFNNLVKEMGGLDIGLSGGYDSRLLLLMAKRHFKKVYAHSHFHSVITSDEICAEKISLAVDVPLYRCAEAKQATEMGIEEFESNIENISVFNDARVIHDYSWLLYFRTRWYREAVLRDTRFGMNGLAGELYRNHDNHCYHKVKVRDWVKARVLTPGSSISVSLKMLNDNLDYFLAKAGITLGIDLSCYITHYNTRRYYGELFSVYGAAVRMNIDNQLAFSLSPFLDYGPRIASYQILPHVGLDGRFEAAMIFCMNPSVAAIISDYGYSFDKREPLSRLAKCAIRGLVPYKLQNIISTIRFDKTIPISKTFETVCKLPLVLRAIELMKSPCFGLNIDQAAHNETLVMRIISIGIMLLKYDDCIEY